MTSNTKKHLIASIFAGSLIFYMLSGVSSLLNYIYYPFISHLVSTSSYGEIQFLTSLFTQLSVGFVVLNILSIILTAKYQTSHEKSSALKSLNVAATSIMLIIIIFGSCILLLNKGSFGFVSPWPILALGVSLLINVPFTITIGRLQGEGKYMLSGIAGALGAGFKLVASVLFVLAGWGTTGAIAGIGVGMFAAIIVANILDGLQLKRPTRPSFSLSELMPLYVRRITHLKDERSLAFTALIAMTVMTVLSTADVLIAKFMLDPHDAGQYAGIATISKTIIYATTPLMWLSLPLALANVTSAVKTIRRYIALTIGVAITLATLFSAVPSFFVERLLGIDAGSYLTLLPLACIGMAVFSLLFIITSIDICRDRLRLTVFQSLATATVFILSFVLIRSHGIIIAVIWAQIIAGFIGIIWSVLGNRIHEKTSN